MNVFDSSCQLMHVLQRISKKDDGFCFLRTANAVYHFRCCRETVGGYIVIVAASRYEALMPYRLYLLLTS